MDTSERITAAIARQRTLTAIKTMEEERLEKLCNYIFGLISQAIRRGDFCVNVDIISSTDEKILQEILKEFRLLGYTVALSKTQKIVTYCGPPSETYDIYDFSW